MWAGPGWRCMLCHRIIKQCEGHEHPTTGEIVKAPFAYRQEEEEEIIDKEDTTNW